MRHIKRDTTKTTGTDHTLDTPAIDVNDIDCFLEKRKREMSRPTFS